MNPIIILIIVLFSTYAHSQNQCYIIAPATYGDLKTTTQLIHDTIKTFTPTATIFICKSTKDLEKKIIENKNALINIITLGNGFETFTHASHALKDSTSTPIINRVVIINHDTKTPEIRVNTNLAKYTISLSSSNESLASFFGREKLINKNTIKLNLLPAHPTNEQTTLIANKNPRKMLISILANWFSFFCEDNNALKSGDLIISFDSRQKPEFCKST